MKQGAQSWQNQQLGQQDLWTLFEEDTEHTIVLPEWPLNNLLAAEKETLGWFVSGHPSDEIVDEFSSITVPLAALAHTKNKVVRVCGMISEWRKMITKKGKTLIILGLAQADCVMEMVIFPDKLPVEMTRFSVGDLVFVEGEVSLDAFRQTNRVVVQKLLLHEQARQIYVKKVKIMLNEAHELVFTELKKLLSVHHGISPVSIVLNTSRFSVEMNLSSCPQLRQ